MVPRKNDGLIMKGGQYLGKPLGNYPTKLDDTQLEIRLETIM